MKKALALIVAIVTLSTSMTFAQDAKAKAVLDKLSGKIKGMSSLKANFTFIAKDAKGKTQLNQKGTLMMKGEKYHVTVPAQEMISDGKTMWTYMKKNKEVQIANYSPADVTMSPTKLFSGSYANDFNYAYAGQQTINGKVVDIVYLTPKATKTFKSVTILVDQSGMVMSGSVEEKNGSYYTYSLSSVQANAAASDALYTFDKKAYPGVEVIDLR
ncbi:outer membrane lipoprotein carrier protein LolA [Taibaiella sp. KBW10]|uniref:outer membrane lipoprotein chaperone LolA n=1 Tax=Taibaiella sp. KBW10 TaxID=2153357 RepID=UPI000F5AE40A|nr:outer membrane lipoprotein chaperone LolA [Taibaiella sp. KBW10]RQO30208.1 outer membrane lipoprotein carrier protein LolA [Taibaiella sp. KBW10]